VNDLFSIVSRIIEQTFMKFYAQKSAAKSKGGGGKPKAEGKEGKAPAKPRKEKAPPEPTTRVVPGIDLDTALNIVGGIMILIGGATLLFGFSPARSGQSDWWIGELKNSFGWGYYFAPVMLILIGGYLVAKQFGDRVPILRPAKIVGVMLAYVCTLMTLHVIGGLLNDVDGATLANAALGGGSVGWAFLRLLQGIGGTAGAPLDRRNRRGHQILVRLSRQRHRRPRDRSARAPTRVQ
jgi:hypothetical protein